MNRRYRATVVGLLTVAVVLTGCHAPAHLGVGTTVVGVHGSCDTSSVVEVGAALPLSGALADLGHAELTGLELGVSQVNRTGGVLSAHHCLELLYKDDRSNPAVDNQALLDLAYRERVTMVVGPFVALDDPANGTNLGSLGVTATSFSSTLDTFAPRTYPYTFPIGSSVAAQAQVVATYAARHQWQRVAALSSGSASSAEGEAAFIAAGRRAGLAVTAIRRPFSTSSKATAALNAVRAAHADALVVVGTGSLGPLLNARATLHRTIPVVASDATQVPKVPGRELVGVAVVVPGALATARSVPAAVASFRARVLQTLHRRVLDGALTPYAQGYDAIEVFAGAVNGVNADDPGSLRTYLENANYQGILGSYNFTSGAHTGLAGSQLTVVPLGSFSNGVFVTKRAGSSS